MKLEIKQLSPKIMIIMTIDLLIGLLLLLGLLWVYGSESIISSLPMNPAIQDSSLSIYLLDQDRYELIMPDSSDSFGYSGFVLRVPGQLTEYLCDGVRKQIDLSMMYPTCTNGIPEILDFDGVEVTPPVAIQTVQWNTFQDSISGGCQIGFQYGLIDKEQTVNLTCERPQ